MKNRATVRGLMTSVGLYGLWWNAYFALAGFPPFWLLLSTSVILGLTMGWFTRRLFGS